MTSHPSIQFLLERLNRLSAEFNELRDGIEKAIRVADLDPEMALTRARKVLEYLVREVYERRCAEPAGTRPLENLLQRLVKDGFISNRLDAYATSVRKLGNVGTHGFGEGITAADVYQSLTQLIPILEWYFEVEKPNAITPAEPARADEPAPRVRSQLDLSELLVGSTWRKANGIELVRFWDAATFFYNRVGELHWTENSYFLGEQFGEMTLVWNVDGFRAPCAFLNEFSAFCECASPNHTWALVSVAARSRFSNG